MNLCNSEEIKALLHRYHFRFSKSMGQNFLIEDWVPRRTAEESGAAPGVGVLEIGPGIGPLTAQLAARSERVLAVELDRHLLPVLEETLSAYDNVEILPGDVMKLDLAALCREHLPGLPVIVCANLPYQITTPVITAMLKAGCFQSITVMIQREVALRICAQPGTADYGAFSVLCQYYAVCEKIYDVPAACFYPAPKVISSVVRMDLRKEPPVAVENPPLFFRVVRACFAQRRKTLLNSLAAAFSPAVSKQMLRQIILSCNLPETIRGERLGIAEFAEITKKLGSYPLPLA